MTNTAKKTSFPVSASNQIILILSVQFTFILKSILISFKLSIRTVCKKLLPASETSSDDLMSLHSSKQGKIVLTSKIRVRL